MAVYRSSAVKRSADAGALPAVGATGTVLVSDGSSASWAKVVDANIDAAAALSLSKLATTGALVATSLTASGFVAVGTNPASAGLIRLGNNQSGVNVRNAANNANITILDLDGSNVQLIGSTGSSFAVVAAQSQIFLRVAGNDKVGCDGTGVGFNGAAPTARLDFTLSNPSIDVRSLTTSEGSETLANGVDVLGTWLKYAIAAGLAS